MELQDSEQEQLKRALQSALKKAGSSGLASILNSSKETGILKELSKAPPTEGQASHTSQKPPPISPISPSQRKQSAPVLVSQGRISPSSQNGQPPQKKCPMFPPNRNRSAPFLMRMQSTPEHFFPASTSSNRSSYTFSDGEASPQTFSVESPTPNVEVEDRINETTKPDVNSTNSPAIPIPGVTKSLPPRPKPVGRSPSNSSNEDVKQELSESLPYYSTGKPVPKPRGQRSNTVAEIRMSGETTMFGGGEVDYPTVRQEPVVRELKYENEVLKHQIMHLKDQRSELEQVNHVLREELIHTSGEFGSSSGSLVASPKPKPRVLSSGSRMSSSQESIGSEASTTSSGSRANSHPNVSKPVPAPRTYQRSPPNISASANQLNTTSFTGSDSTCVLPAQENADESQTVRPGPVPKPRLPSGDKLVKENEEEEEEEEEEGMDQAQSKPSPPQKPPRVYTPSGSGKKPVEASTLKQIAPSSGEKEAEKSVEPSDSNQVGPTATEDAKPLRPLQRLGVTYKKIALKSDASWIQRRRLASDDSDQSQESSTPMTSECSFTEARQIPQSRPHVPTSESSVTEANQIPQSTPHVPTSKSSVTEVRQIPQSTPHVPTSESSVTEANQIPQSRPHIPTSESSVTEANQIPQSTPHVAAVTSESSVPVAIPVPKPRPRVPIRKAPPPPSHTRSHTVRAGGHSYSPHRPRLGAIQGGSPPQLRHPTRTPGSGSNGDSQQPLRRSNSDESLTGSMKRTPGEDTPPEKPPRTWITRRPPSIKESGGNGFRPMSMMEESHSPNLSELRKQEDFIISCTVPRSSQEEFQQFMHKSPKRSRQQRFSSDSGINEDRGSPRSRKRSSFFGKRRGKKQQSEIQFQAPPMLEEEDEEVDGSDSSSEDEKGGTIKFMPKLRHVSMKKSRSNSVEEEDEPEYHQLFEYVFVVGLKQDPSTKALVTEMKYTFPPASGLIFNGKDAALQSIPQFCFPDIDQWKPTTNYTSETFSFVLTDMEGSRRFGYCRRLLPSGSGRRLPEVYCIVSPLGCFSLYEKILDHVEERRAVSSSAVFTFLKAIVANPFPRPGRSVEVKAFSARGTGMETVVFDRPMDSRLEHVDFSLLFTTLSPRKIIQLFSSMLMERRIILCAHSLSLVTSCAHALLALMYPFEWQHVFIPVLPSSLIDFCCSPLPYMIGINPSCIKQLDGLDMEEALVVDLDKRKFVKKIGDETSILPSKLFEYLEHSLSSSVITSEYLKPLSRRSSPSRADEIVINTFMTFFVYLYGDYKQYMKAVNTGMMEFQKKDYVKRFSSKSTRRFLEAFHMTQMFEGFIEQRENPLKAQTVAHSLFEKQKIPELRERCQEIEIFSSKSKFNRWKMRKGLAKKK